MKVSTLNCLELDTFSYNFLRLEKLGVLDSGCTLTFQISAPDKEVASVAQDCRVGASAADGEGKDLQVYEFAHEKRCG